MSYKYFRVNFIIYLEFYFWISHPKLLCLGPSHDGYYVNNPYAKLVCRPALN